MLDTMPYLGKVLKGQGLIGNWRFHLGCPWKSSNDNRHTILYIFTFKVWISFSILTNCVIVFNAACLWLDSLFSFLSRVLLQTWEHTFLLSMDSHGCLPLRVMKITPGVLVVLTAVWMLLNLLEYHLIALICHILIIGLAGLFLCSYASSFINMSPPQILQISLSNDICSDVASEILSLWNIWRPSGSFSGKAEAGITKHCVVFVAKMGGFLFKFSSMGPLGFIFKEWNAILVTHGFPQSRLVML